MKKLSLLFCLFLALTATAQVTVKPGIRAGLNLSTLTNTNLDTKPDFYVGGFVAIKLAKFYTLQPELTYTRQGAKGDTFYYDYSPGFDPVVSGRIANDVDYSIQYLSLAIMNKFNIVEGFHATVGPTIDFRVGDNFRDYTVERPFDMDIGLNAGLGYTLPIGLTIEARYKIGFLDIFGDNVEEGYYYEDSRIETRLNSVVQLGLAYTF